MPRARPLRERKRESARVEWWIVAKTSTIAHAVPGAPPLLCETRNLGGGKLGGGCSVTFFAFLHRHTYTHGLSSLKLKSPRLDVVLCRGKNITSDCCYQSLWDCLRPLVCVCVCVCVMGVVGDVFLCPDGTGRH